MVTAKSSAPDQPHYIRGYISTRTGNIPRVSGKLTRKDLWGTIRVRWSVNRDNYRVTPGLYALGNPAELSDVFVTANYKLSFDHLRRNLDGLDAWILVLDTKGINVWCAAGKGTFSTGELVNKIRTTRLEEVISHRRLILPQLGAVGVSAYQVKEQTNIVASVPLISTLSSQTYHMQKPSPDRLSPGRGFNVIFGPVKAQHIKEFIRNKYIATPAMRRVTFTFPERSRLIPVDFLQGKYQLLLACALIFVVSGLSNKGISFEQAAQSGPLAMMNVLMAYIAGIVLTPLMLPYIPGRSFAFKGFITGMFMFALLMIKELHGMDRLTVLAWFLIITGMSSYAAMNFTGSSTYTSLSGVRREMRTAIPVQIAFSAVGLILFILGKVI